MTSRAPLDRALVLLTGLGLVATGLVLLDWQQGVVLPLGDRLDTTGAIDLSDEAWWPWVQGAVAVVVALLALVWLTSHRPHRGPRRARLSPSDPTGTVDVDLDSLGHALAGFVEASGAATDAHVAFHRDRGRTLAVLEARVGEDADLATVVAAAEEAAADLQASLPGEELDLQVRWRAPRARRTVRSRRATVRVE